MLVTFIGSPCSGKTTVAALIFSALKDGGVPTEFLPEQARLYIAERRAVTTHPIHLTDVDQMLIMKKQLDAEALMLKACGPEVVLVTDSSPLNSLLYMNTWARNEPAVREAIFSHRQHRPLAFYVNTVSPGFGADPNRIHDMKTSKAIDSELPDLMAAEAPWLNYVHLVGDSRHRTDVALSMIFTQLLHPS
jgi:hypothetical protein